MYAFALAAVLAAQGALTLRTASGHPMKYYESLPKGWTADKAWPVLVVIESADREFEKNAREFVKARGDRPFVIVAPLVLTNGGSRVRDVPTYRYDDATWACIDREGPWTFDEAGLKAMLDDVAKEGGTWPADWTAWEAGCHTLWAVSFDHPDWVRSAALVGPNYLGRWVKFGDPPADGGPRLCVFGGSEDPAWASGKPLYDQAEEAKKAAAAQGFTHVSTKVVPGKGHGALPEAVVAWMSKAH